MTVVFFWTGATSYMAACWRELAEKPGVRLKVYVEVKHDGTTAYRHREVLGGLDYHLRFEGDPFDREAFRREIAELAPDVLVVLGWRCPMCRFVAKDRAFNITPKVFTFDMTFAFTARKLLARYVLWRYLRRFVCAVVPSDASVKYAKYLGFGKAEVTRGLIGLDTSLFSCAYTARIQRSAYPRQFLYVGRYTREKRLDQLLEAYRLYRSKVAQPWGLTCCGTGPDSSLFEHAEGVKDIGFVQPSEMPELYAAHGAFVIASEYDPWPLVIAEAVASGLPVVCTAACGSHTDFVRDFENGRVCETNRAEALSDALVWVHAHESELASMGAKGMSLVAPFDKAIWAQQWVERCERILTRGH